MLLLLILCATAASAIPSGGDSPVSSHVVAEGISADHAGEPVLHPFVSFSIEFAWFPTYAGTWNLSTDCHFMIRAITMARQLFFPESVFESAFGEPRRYPRDWASYDPDLKTAINGTVIPSISTDYPRILSIGPSFFESYSTWPDTKFIHGFNLAHNGSKINNDLLETIPVACKALDGKLAYWELGNEPNNYKTAYQGASRPSNWTTQDYVDEWLSRTSLIKKKLAKSCPHLTNAKYIAPSTGLPTGILNPVDVFKHGLKSHHNIALNSEHNYMGGADEPGVTLQKTLMNHTAVINSVENHLKVIRTLKAQNLDLPYIYGEMNSLYNQGRPGLSNSFGAALWGVDFNLYSASQSIRRSHMHQGNNYRYASWQPEETNKTSIGTKAPYYGNVMVAAMLKGADDVRVATIPLPGDTEAAYAAFVDGQVARLAVINMKEYNYSTSDPDARRPATKYSFRLPNVDAQRKLSVQRLMANGSNSITGITWDGWSYNYNLKKGAPVRLHNVTVGETVPVHRQGWVEIEVPDSSGAILSV
ncbi:hypothetical protein PHISCL_05760 [Aspergillus sclerotialis]|uniref:Beta-glucuronidase C-terminal domain-containing protein n=1 Tax=Aspergillus sclerotialis TaxID=2070753 RepID=A0A3A2ZV80_9EURO|nr:hypothetical protein PHISCL_05760 [Aspergillus sclerotialis]